MRTRMSHLYTYCPHGHVDKVGILTIMIIYVVDRYYNDTIYRLSS